MGDGGVKLREGRKCALGALEKVGLSDRIKHEPNKISGSRNKE
jgi:predicted ABC-type transport system involved in lysophospholipase L1 biosynthesis ATPase subunit